MTAEEEQSAERLSTELEISPIAGRILAGRGIRTAAEARAYIRPSLDSLHDPFLMRDMGLAVDRLCRAIDNHERIMVYGDYDVDGTTAVALMYSFLKTQTDNLVYYIPDRYTEGYGISTKGIDTAKEKGCTLVIALDCGIKAVDKMDYANRIGVDFIICDHHTPGDITPRAVAVLNMKRADCLYPYKELSGCGVGFKLVQAYAQRKGIDPKEIYRLLPLLAMSIASDVVPLTGENRILAYYGLRALNASPSVGVQAIMQVAGIAGKTVNMNDLVFKFGPRINAAGRIKSGAEAVRLLITDDAEAALQFARDIDSYNQDRRNYDTKTTEEALEQLQKDPMNSEKFTTVVYSPQWHKGVVGIAASRLTETFYRPTIVLSCQDGIASGSARSVAGYDIYDAIKSCRDLLENFGGHTYAVGLSLKVENIPAFRQRFQQYVSTHIQPEQTEALLDIESELDFKDITKKLQNDLKKLAPHGPDNPKPLFCTRNVYDYGTSKVVGKQQEHIKLELVDSRSSNVMNGIAFGQSAAARYIKSKCSFDIIYTIEENIYKRGEVQLQIEDIKPSDA